MYETLALPRRRGKGNVGAGFIPPLLPTLVDQPPAGSDWQHEIKHDGYRTEIVLTGDGGRAFTRNGIDWSNRYAALISAALEMHCKSAHLDGEMIVQDEHGRSDFNALRAAIERPGEHHRLIFYAFDLLERDGEDLRKQQLLDRREQLRQLIGGHDPGYPIQFSEGFAGDASELLTAACGHGLEGIVSKKVTSRYVSGRSRVWLKTKCYAETEFTVVGAEHEPGKPAFALLARETPDGLQFAGSAFLTLTGADRDQFWTLIDDRARPRPIIPMPKGKSRRWVDPIMRVRVQHLAGEHDKLRHASIKALLP